jgi:exodeoxyribonuclease VII large subunit
MEELWAFNSETVVREVAGSSAPVVSGIGHETDVLLSDFAADLRAPTPSAAAELATPDRAELMLAVEGFRGQLRRIWRESSRQLRAELSAQQAALALASPRAQVNNARQRVDELLRRATSSARHLLALRRSAVAGLTQTLGAVGPQTVLARGYAVVRRAADDRVVRSVKQVKPGDGLSVRVSDGSFSARASDREQPA